MKKSYKDLVILIIKIALYSILFMIFFTFFSNHNIALQNLSRTSVITMMTFAVVGIMMLFVYGNFEVGKKKSKQIITSTIIGILFTNLVTYIQLMVMNTNPNNNANFRLEQLDLLLITFVVQCVVIVIFSYFGNWIYFKLNRPLKTLIVVDHLEQSATDHINVRRFLERFKLQYEIVDVVNAKACNMKEYENIIEYVVFVNVRSNERKPLIDICYKNDINFAYSPSISDVLELSGDHVTFDDKPMLDVNVHGLSIEQRIFKRLIDIVVALVGIVLSSPIWIVSAIAIKLGDGGKILFKQDRYTINGAKFKVYKFRTMKENVANYSSVADDDRITKVGKVLRKIRMDELPQLLNILMGDMSVVGPRPEMVENVEKYEADLPEFRYRLRVKAGLTGIAQIEGKYNTSPYDKLIMDLVYIENYSVWSDIKLILRTVIVLFKSDSTEAFEGNDKTQN